MNTTIEVAKEILDKTLITFNPGERHNIAKSMVDFAKAEHQRKCEEAGKDIDYVKFKIAVTDYYGEEEGDNSKCHLGANFGYTYLKNIFSSLLASLQSKLIEEQKISNRYLTAWEKQLEEIEQLQSQLAAKEKEIEDWIKKATVLDSSNRLLDLESKHLKSQLQEAKVANTYQKERETEAVVLLEKLWRLKQLKDKEGKTLGYQMLQPTTWVLVDNYFKSQQSQKD